MYVRSGDDVYESKMCGVKDWESWGWYYHYLKIITLEEIWTESLIASQQALIDRTPTLLVIQNKKYWLLHFILIYYQVYNWNILCRRVYLNSLSPGFYSVSLRLRVIVGRNWAPVMFRGYWGDFHSPGRECWLFIGWQTLRNVPEIRDHLHGHPACVNGLFTKHGPLQRMLMRCRDDATPVRCGSRGGDTNNDPDLGMRARGGPCPCRRTPGRWPIVCQCAGVRTVGPKKAKVLFLARARRLREGLGGRPLSKSSSFWILGPMKGKWRVMKSYGDRFQKQPITLNHRPVPGIYRGPPIQSQPLSRGR